MAEWTVKKVQTTPFEGQKPGTSGLRKRVKEFRNGYYLHNFVQSIFNALPKEEVKGATLVLGGTETLTHLLTAQVMDASGTRRPSRSSSKFVPQTEWGNC